MKMWTVLLLRPDYAAENYGQDVYCDFCAAETPEEGLIVARENVRDADCYIAPAEDYYCIYITEGMHFDRSGGLGEATKTDNRKSYCDLNIQSGNEMAKGRKSL